MKCKVMCIKYIDRECLVCYSYLSKTRDGGSVVGLGNVTTGQRETLG